MARRRQTALILSKPQLCHFLKGPEVQVKAPAVKPVEIKPQTAPAALAPKNTESSWFGGLFSSPLSTPKLSENVYGLYNPDLNCFMNATFQMIMNDEALCQALVETYTPLVESYKVQMQVAQGADFQTCKKYYEAYKTFIDTVALYKSGDSEKLRKVDLDPLRFLLGIYASRKNPNISGSKDCSMGDAEEFLNALLYDVDLKKYNVGFRQGYRRTYQLLGTETRLPRENLDPENKLTPTLKLEMRKNATGQQLINDLFAPQKNLGVPEAVVIDDNIYTLDRAEVLGSQSRSFNHPAKTIYSSRKN